MHDIRVIETTDGLYLNLEDIQKATRSLMRLYPGYVSHHIYKMFQEGRKLKDVKEVKNSDRKILV